MSKIELLYEELGQVLWLDHMDRNLVTRGGLEKPASRIDTQASRNETAALDNIRRIPRCLGGRAGRQGSGRRRKPCGRVMGEGTGLYGISKVTS